MGRCLYCMQKVEDGLSACPHCKAPIPLAPERPQDLRPGTILHDRYIVGRALGHGGYGITYLAYDQHLGGIHVIKEYFPRNGGRTEEQTITFSEERTMEVERTRKRFLYEAQLMTMAKDLPNVVRVDNQFDENGTSYILMDYLDGATLDEWIFRRQRRFSWQEATKIIVAALEGLQGLHQKGILHRDISCSNIFLCNNGKVCLIDFGSAELITDAMEHPATIQSSVKMPYTSPEQMQGRPQGTPTDVYAMAEVLFKAITRKGDQSLAGKELPPIRSMAPELRVPAKLDKALQEATIQDPEKRTQTAEKLRKQLYELVKPRHTVRNILLAAAGVAVAAVFAMILLRQQELESWQMPTVSFSDSTNVHGDTKTVGLDERVEVQGTARAGEKLVLEVVGADLMVHHTPTADRDGNWTDIFYTDGLEVAVDAEQRYQIVVKYQDNGAVLQEKDLYLLVSNKYADLRMSYLTEQGIASVNQDIEIGGTRQEYAPVIVTITDDDGIVEETVISGEGGEDWFYSFSTSDLPVRDELTQFKISAAYEETGKTSPDELTLAVQPELKQPTMIYNGADIVRDNTAFIRLSGTSSMKQLLRISAEVIEEDAELLTWDISSNNDGEWNAQIRVADLGVLEDETKDFEFSVKYLDHAEIEMASSPVLIRVAIPLNMAQPGISIIGDDGKTSGRIVLTDMNHAFSFGGTAARNQNILLYLDGEVFSGATADTNGNWVVGPFTAADLGLREGMDDVMKRIYVAYEADPTNRSGNEVTVIAHIEETLTAPTIQFMNTEEDSVEYNSQEKVRFVGTAVAEKALTLRIQDESQRFTKTYQIDTDKDGNWGYEVDLSAFGIGIGETVQYQARVNYWENTNIVSDRILTMIVSNPAYSRPVLSLSDGNGGDITIGGNDGLTFQVSGAQPRMELQLMLSGRVFATENADEDGKATFELSNADLKQYNNVSVNVRYTNQTTISSDYLNITIDREALPVTVPSAITEEDTSLSGYAESGSLVMLYNGDQQLAMARASDEDGSFTLIWAAGQKLQELRLEATDPYGNNAPTKNIQVTETPRQQIQILTPSLNEIYGPNSLLTQVSGLATAGKGIRIEWEDKETIVFSDPESGEWSTEITLPEFENSGVATIKVTYEDGKLAPISVAMTGDFETEEPKIVNSLLTQDTEEIIINLERGSKARVNGGAWIEDDVNSGQVIVPVTNLTPKEGVLIEIQDPYGNKSNASFEVSIVSNRVYGLIREPSTVKNLTGSDTMDIQAYVVAGEAADISSRTVEVYPSENFQESITDDHSLVTIRLSDNIVGAELEMIAQTVKAEKDEMTKGWKTLFRNFSPMDNQLETGEYQLALYATVNGQRQYLAGTRFHYEKVDVQVGNGAAQDGDGWLAGIDAPQETFNPNSVWLTGYYYHDEIMPDLSEVTFNFYSDSDCTEQLATVSTTPTLYSRTQELDQVDFEVANTTVIERRGTKTTSNTAGIILLCKYPLPKGEKIAETRAVYAVLTSEDNQDIALGPFEMRLNSAEKTTTVKTIKKNAEQSQ